MFMRVVKIIIGSFLSAFVGYAIGKTVDEMLPNELP